MWKKTKRSAGLAALAFVALFLGPATSKASAWDGGPRVAFHGRFGLPHGRVSVFGSRGHFIGHRPLFAARRFDRPFFRPFRVVRVRVLTPFPHWVFRRAYLSAPVGSYCAPY
jgi:hypothetical protein